MRYRLLLTLWLLTDLAVFLKLYALSYFLRVGWIFSTDFPFGSFIMIVALVAPAWLAVLATTRTFGLTRNQQTFRNGAYICYAAVVGGALFALSYYFVFGFFFSRLLLLSAIALTAAGTWIWHILFSVLMRHMLRRDPPTFPMLVIGVTRESAALIKTLNDRKNPLKPIAILDGRGSKDQEIAGVPVLGKLNKLEETLQEKKITHLLQCSDLEQSLNLLSACRSHGITYMLMPSVLGIVEKDERVDSLEGNPVTIVSPKGGLLSWFFV
jgi:FlaA1/EpsC-like NDP-sugar epimerase